MVFHGTGNQCEGKRFDLIVCVCVYPKQYSFHLSRQKSAPTYTTHIHLHKRYGICQLIYTHCYRMYMSKIHLYKDNTE